MAIKVPKTHPTITAPETSINVPSQGNPKISVPQTLDLQGGAQTGTWPESFIIPEVELLV